MVYTNDTKPTSSFSNGTKPTSTFSADAKPANTVVSGGGSPIGLALILTYAGGAATSIYSNDSKPS